MKKIISIPITIVLLGACAFGGYYYYQHKLSASSVTEEENKLDKEIKSVPITSSTDMLSDKERVEFSTKYEELADKISSKVTVSDEEINDYIRDTDGIQYPNYKVTVVDGDKTSYYFIQDKDIASEDCNVDPSKIQSIRELTDEDKRDFVKTLIHNNKVTNVILKEIGK